MLLSQEYKEQWSLLSKLTFRLAFTYFVLYIFFMFTGALFETPFRWVGNSILGIEYNYDVSGYGSGDNTFAYITLFITFIFTLFIVPVWSILERHKKSYNILFYWFLAFLRLILVVTMFLYGSVKIFQIQFPQPNLMKLLEPLGNFSPMGLAWTYMGYSEGFNMFTGFMEITGALLLIPRRTQTLGAFIIMGVMTHVAVMNFMFDIPVKLLSTHLIFMALVIFMTDIKRFTNVFFTNKDTGALNYYHPINDETYHKVIFWLKSVFLFIIVIAVSFIGYQGERNQGHKRDKPFLYGIWEASYFIKNKDTLPPLITDQYRWRYLVLDFEERASVKVMNDTKLSFNFIVDSITKEIKIYKRDSVIGDFNFRYKYPNENFLQLDGIINNDTLQIILSRKDLNDFNLKSRKFHWINESPYNR